MEIKERLKKASILSIIDILSKRLGEPQVKEVVGILKKIASGAEIDPARNVVNSLYNPKYDNPNEELLHAALLAEGSHGSVPWDITEECAAAVYPYIEDLIDLPHLMIVMSEDISFIDNKGCPPKWERNGIREFAIKSQKYGEELKKEFGEDVATQIVLIKEFGETLNDLDMSTEALKSLVLDNYEQKLDDYHYWVQTTPIDKM